MSKSKEFINTEANEKNINGRESFSSKSDQTYKDFTSEFKDDAARRLHEFGDSSEIVDQIKKLAKDTHHFVQKNPWAAVAGVFVIGYVLGSMTRRKS